MAKKELTLRELKVQAISERKEGRLVELPEKFFEKLHNLERMLLEILKESESDQEKKERVNEDMRKFTSCIFLKLDFVKKKYFNLCI